MPLALFILCLISRISEGDTAGQCKPSERSISGKALTGHTYKAVTVSRPFECQVLCENDSKCRSYNFFLPEKICEMNSKTKEAEPQDFVKDDLRFHMKREDIDECKEYPSICDVNAKCQNTDGSYLCHCNPGFTGDGKKCYAPSVTATSSCANLLIRDVSNSSGIIQSSREIRYHYSNNMDCHWNLSSNTRLELTFSIFKTEALADYVAVYDGDSRSSPLIGRFSGSSLLAAIESSSNKLHVHFTTNANGKDSGFRARYRAITAGSIRINGSTRLTGRVEIFNDDQWGTICDDQTWDINDANVVCKQLGSPKAAQAFSGAHHGKGSGPIWMAGVSCSGSESHIYDCSQSGWGNNNCTHDKDATVQCLPVRLANGAANYGRVEVFLNGIWGTVCDDYWDIKESHVVCRELGFPSASSALPEAAYGRGSGPVWLDDVNCQGGEASLLDCRHRGWGVVNCGNHEDVGVICNT